jgi:hypothetical protein
MPRTLSANNGIGILGLESITENRLLALRGQEESKERRVQFVWLVEANRISTLCRTSNFPAMRFLELILLSISPKILEGDWLRTDEIGSLFCLHEH